MGLSKPCKRCGGIESVSSGACKACNLEYIKQWNSTAKGRKIRLKAYRTFNAKYKIYNRYGLTVQQYENLLIKQQGRCAICLKECSNHGKKLNVDHNHRTNKIRGLLCHRCNVMLGLA